MIDQQPIEVAKPTTMEDENALHNARMDKVRDILGYVPANYLFSVDAFTLPTGEELLRTVCKHRTDESPAYIERREWRGQVVHWCKTVTALRPDEAAPKDADTVYLETLEVIRHITPEERDAIMALDNPTVH